MTGVKIGRDRPGKGRRPRAAGGVLLLASVLALACPSLAAEGPAAGEKDFAYPEFVPRKVKLQVGEKLTYRVKWTTIAAGETTLQVEAKELKDGAETYRIVSRTRSNKFVDMFYKVRDSITTWIDANECFSRGFNMHQREGRHKSSEVIRFDYERGWATYRRVKRGKKREVKIDLPGKVQDALSVLYYMRFSEFGADRRLPEMTVATNRKIYRVSFKVLGRGRIKVKGLGRTYNALKIWPDADYPGLFVRKGEMTIWVEEKSRIPLLMKVDIPVGSISVILYNAEKSPLNE